MIARAPRYLNQKPTGSAMTEGFNAVSGFHRVSLARTYRSVESPLSGEETGVTDAGAVVALRPRRVFLFPQAPTGLTQAPGACRTPCSAEIPAPLLRNWPKQP